MSEPEGTPGQRHWGGCAVALVVLGLLLLISAGLCTSVFGLALFDSQGDHSMDGFLSAFWLPLVFGGPVILVGIVLVRLGLNARRRQ